jgi:hypothetical protein
VGSRLLHPYGCTFPFVVRDNQVLFTTNFGSALPGYQWLGIGGAVLDLSNQALPGLCVHVWNYHVDLYMTSGTNCLYLPKGGWEIQLDTTINTQAYLIQLQTYDGVAISPTVMITFPGDWEHNLAIIVFKQIQPF